MQILKMRQWRKSSLLHHLHLQCTLGNLDLAPSNLNQLYSIPRCHDNPTLHIQSQSYLSLSYNSLSLQPHISPW